MIAGIEIENGSCDPDHAPLRGGLSSTCYGQLTTKLALSITTRYEDMKGDTKYRKWFGLGVVRVTQGH